MTKEDTKQIKVVKTPAALETRQAVPYFIGLSNKTVGSKSLAMHLVVIPPGGSAKPHYHKEFETGIYVLEGRVETYYGDQLQYSVINEAGDFIYIPPDLIHQPVNLDKVNSARALVVRNDPNEQENVVPVSVTRRQS